MSRTRRIWTLAGAGSTAALTVALAVAVAAPSGALREVEIVGHPSISNANDVEVAGDGKHVYGVGFSGDSIGVFSRNANTGDITFVEETDGDGLDAPEGISVAPNGNNVYVAGLASNSVHSYERDADGTLNNIDSDVQGDGATTGLDEATDVVAAAGNKHVYVTGKTNQGSVALFHRVANGTLVWADAFLHGTEDIVDMRQPRGLTISPDGKNLYVASGQDGTVVTFKRFKDTGQLDFVESDKVFSPANGVEVAPDGKRVYVASNEGVRTFSRNTQTGALTPIGLTEGTDEKPLTTVGGLGAAPAGDHVYAAAGTTVSGVATLATRRSTKLGYQEFDNMGTGIGGTSAADVSPDGRHVYVSGGSNGSGKIGVYSRQPKLDLKGKKRQVASKLAVKAECSADCKVVLTGKGLKTATAKLQAGEPKRVRVRFKNSPPSSGKVTIKGKAKAGDRTAFDKLKVTLK